MKNIFRIFSQVINNKKNKKKLGKIGVNCNFGKNTSIIGGKKIIIGDNFKSGSFLSLQTWSKYNGITLNNSPQIIIGNDVSLMRNCCISAVDSITIGDGCLIGDNVLIADNSHGSNTLSEFQICPAQRNLFSKGPILIGKNVWIGRNVCILSGVTIGDGCIIGANSVVTHSVPKMTIVAGTPARIIKKVE